MEQEKNRIVEFYKKQIRNTYPNKNNFPVEKFESLMNDILQLDFWETSLELSDGENIVFELKFGDNKLLIIEIPLKNDEVVYGYYDNKICVQNGSGSFERVIGMIKGLRLVI